MTTNSKHVVIPAMYPRIFNVSFTSVNGNIYLLKYDNKPYIERIDVRAVSPTTVSTVISREAETLIDTDAKIVYILHPYYLTFDAINQNYIEKHKVEFIPYDSLSIPSNDIIWMAIEKLFQSLLRWLTNPFTNMEILHNFHPNDHQKQLMLSERSIDMYSQILKNERRLERPDSTI